MDRMSKRKQIKVTEAKDPMLKQDAAKFLADVPDQNVFWCSDGSVFRNMKDLAEHLNSMSDETFTYHSNGMKNDFTTWVKDVIGDSKLADDLMTAATRSTAAAVATQRTVALQAQM